MLISVAKILCVLCAVDPGAGSMGRPDGTATLFLVCCRNQTPTVSSAGRSMANVLKGRRSETSNFPPPHKNNGPQYRVLSEILAHPMHSHPPMQGGEASESKMSGAYF